MTRHPHPKPRRAGRQRGAVLVGALLFLMILTVLGSGGVVNTMLQERMASNARNRDLAFQAAEHALEDADKLINQGNAESYHTKATMLLLVSDATPGIRDVTDRAVEDLYKNDVEYWRNTFDWTSADLREPDGASLGFVAGQPKYLIERLPPVADCDLATLGNQPCDYYRVTARGLGGTGETAVILQTLYEFPDD